MSYDWAASLGLIMVFIGFAVIFAAIVMAVLSGGKTKGEGVILIGPFPIVFGSDVKVARSLMYLAIVLIVIFMVLSFLLPFMFSEGWRSL